MTYLTVYWNNISVGVIKKNHGRWQFQYSSTWLGHPKRFPISISLPLRQELFDDSVAHPFFANLLPESDIRDQISKRFGFSLKNDFELLKAIGGECAGAISISSESNKDTNLQKGEYIYIEDKKLKKMILQQNKRPLLVGEDNLRLSLAGAQQKLPVYIKNEKIYLPTGAKASTHIIKPAMRDFEDSVFNEAFCMELATRIGFSVAPVKIRTVCDVHVLTVKRYDRSIKGGNVTRMHQEDFCQALGYPYYEKYESEGGPTLAKCFDAIDKYSGQGLLDKKRLLEWVIFNYYIGNADAHAKNISFLYNKNKISLAPFYDLLSTIVYPGLSKKMAMKIGKENRFNWIKERHLKRLAETINIKPDIVFETFEIVGKSIKRESKNLLEKFENNGYKSNILDKIFKYINRTVL